LSILVATSAAKFERFSRQADAPQDLSLFCITVTKVSHGLGFQGQIAFRMKDGKRLFKILGGLFQISLATEYRTDGGICHGLSHLVPGGLPAPNSFLEFGNRLPALVPPTKATPLGLGKSFVAQHTITVHLGWQAQRDEFDSITSSGSGR